MSHGEEDDAGAAAKGRRPQRRRGQARFEQLLDAAERLLAVPEDRDVSLAMVAEEADVPLPSLYHFFPNRNALLVALAERFIERLGENAHRPLDPPPQRWQDIILRRQRIGADWLNGHPAALRLFMGAGVSVDVRTLDLRGNASLARVRADEFRRWFDCSALPRLDDWMAITIGLTDGIWAISWAEHRRVTDECLAESGAAAVAYLRTYLPEVLARHPQDTR
ncbi:TetR/AcrR family transcriptional regulator [Acuticoccus sediminis]|uniref:TetR/AcrR family transcriptional regulator n=1 Tax=Acuticoccus sediminis TaxID=2184697 RepID=UPI0013913346|nr:TetR/AcrR family transcriptional regulator [Acuticoccus sediminis]